MKKYFIHKKASKDGKLTMHASDCRILPTTQMLDSLGYFIDYNKAIEEANKIHYNIEGCVLCKYL